MRKKTSNNTDFSSKPKEKSAPKEKTEIPTLKRRKTDSSATVCVEETGNVEKKERRTA